MQKNTKSLNSAQVLSFLMPRRVLDRQNGQVFVILHGWHTVMLFTVRILLNCLKNKSGLFTVTCTPFDFGQGTTCPQFTLLPMFIEFVHMSSEDTGPDVYSNLFLRVDIKGMAHERRCRSFEPVYHRALVDD